MQADKDEDKVIDRGRRINTYRQTDRQTDRHMREAVNLIAVPSIMNNFKLI